MNDRVTHDDLRDLVDEELVRRLVAHMDAEQAALAAEDPGDGYGRRVDLVDRVYGMEG